MAIPNTSISVTESITSGTNTLIPFIPAVILKTKTGPIGQITRVNSKSSFVSLFGNADSTTPAAFALEKYLSKYQYAYVTRASNIAQAKKGTATVSFKPDTVDVSLLSVETNYMTDLENGKTVKIVTDVTNNKIYLDLSDIFGKTMTTIKEDISIGTVKAAVYDANHVLTGGLEYILDKLVASANAITGTPIKITNLFTNKIDTDTVPTTAQFTAGFSGIITEGNSGNDTLLENSVIYGLIDAYDYQNYPIDEMVIPEYRSSDVVNYAVQKGLENFYRVIANATGSTVDNLQSSVVNYVADDKGTLEIYAPDVYYTDFVDSNGNMIACPACIAVLNAYASANNNNQWNAIAGYTNGVLPNVAGLSIKLSKADADKLYDATLPINTINYISSVGYIVWGNKTTYSSTSTTFFDRVNIARLVTYMQKKLTQVSWEYLFQPITLSLMTNFKNGLEAICQNVQDSNGISDYSVVCNSSNNTDASIANNELHAEIQIKPTESLEYVMISLSVTDTVTANVGEGSVA
jgi:hypothetical protein